ncbi:amino acid adenylation domain-containing protein [Lysobacter sp. K5869]|uniref:non-ribosomal peptide synthetase n=1 Tax=Lysobacter sp. K5869 TaxID=2820808 RepID=UPI001C0616DF|nr:non-ribosomal peptide synthetase [Lysobacter sp. K5869]QWP75370.1 amino acid adenylation domain-containing protein [Lysobacter sp. K5869]
MVSMDLAALLRELGQRRVTLSVVDGTLRSDAPRGAITPELADAIRAHKPALIAALERSAASAAAAPEPILPAPPADAYPLSFAQRRLWFVDALGGGSPQYNLPGALRLRGRLDAQALQRALDALLARHTALRTVFAERDGEPVQQVRPAQPLAVVRHDLEALDPAVRAQRLDALLRDQAGTAFALSADLLLRVALVRLSEREHVLAFASHHIAGDGWSMGLLVRDMAALYAAFAEGRADPLPAPALSYADYACWQHSRGGLEQGLQWWCERLRDAPALLELPTDRARPPRASHRGASVALRVPAMHAEGLRALARRHGGTLFMSLLAGWSSLLSRLSGQDEVVIGTPTANRQRRETESIVGFFVNTLALRLAPAAAGDVGALMRQVRETTLGAYDHQDVPFEQVVEALRPVRDLGHHPVFQTLLSLDNTPGGRGFELPGLEVDAVSMPHDTAHCDLTATFVENADGSLGGALEYARDLFDEASALRLAERLQAMLAGLAQAADDLALSALPLLSAQERTQVVETFNDTARPYPADSTIAREFAACVARRGDAEALWSAGETVGYAELDRRANLIANGLRERGIGREDRVVLLGRRSADLVVATLGVLKAGAAYVPLDPEQPAERLAELIADSGARAVLADGDVADALPLSWRAWSDYSDAAPEVDGTAEDLAYVMYTSGSTGTPKGVMVENRAVLRLAVNGGFAPLGDQDVVAHCANPAFDASTWELWGALLNGACVAVIEPETVLDPKALSASLKQAGVTAMWLTVGLFNAYVDELEDVFGQLDQLLIGGDALDVRTVARLLSREHRPRRLINGYGPTETTTFAATHDIVADDTSGRSIPIGRPIHNTTIRIVDAQGQPVPVGVTGEVFIGGAGVARGYLNRPELSAEKFVADPLGGAESFYRSGDLGRWRSDGSIEFMGRNDGQIKLRGFRIELGEIEAALQQLPGTREAVAVVREDEAVGRRLIAYLVGSEGDASQWRQALAAKLPEYMLPAAFVALDALPLTANGKIDRRALPAPDESALAAQRYVAPRDAAETALCAIFAELLRVERVGIHDNFFELGGHSLLAARLAARVAAELRKQVPVGAVFEHSTPARLAAFVAAAAATAAPLAAADPAEPLRLSFAQQRLWFLDRLDRAASAAYHMPSALRLQGELNLPALRAALDRIVARHSVLRTRFAEAEGAAAPWIADADEGLPLREDDLSALGADEREHALIAIAREEALAPFDLAAQRPIRARLTRLSGDEHALFLTLHHIVSDGWSNGVLTRELSELYRAFAAGEADPLPPLPLQYADYAAWQRCGTDATTLESQLSFWREHLRDAPERLELPGDRERPAAPTHAGAMLPFELGADASARLRDWARGQGASVFMALLTGWSALLSRLSGQDEVVIGSPVANRPSPSLEPLIGFFVNTLPLRVRLPADIDASSLLARIKTDSLAALAHQDVPFEQIVDALKPTRQLAYHPLFQAALALDNTPQGEARELPGLRLSALGQAHASTRFDLTLSVSDGERGIRGVLEYATDLFDEATVRRWLRYLTAILTALPDAGAKPLSALPLLSAQERTQVVETFNDTARPYPADSTIAREFAACVARRGDAAALWSAGETVGYAELDRRANRIANGLRERGIGREDRVVLLGRRSVDLVVATLAVLKAGAAYVPLDPEQPAERLAELIADSGAKAVLADNGFADALPLSWRAWSGHADVAPEVDGGADDLAYVIYTSGSTGTPKGVMVENRAVLRLAVNGGFAPLGDQDVVAHCANPAFDASTWELWGALLNGACVAVIEPETVLDPKALSASLKQAGVTAMWLTVGLFNAYVDELEDVFGQLDQLLIGGDALDVRTVAKLLSREHRPRRLINGYGPTETTTFAATHDIVADDTSGRSIPIGRPIHNTTIRIVDAQGQPVPVGVTGEVFIGGAGVARGYLNRPELSAEKFVADPLGGAERFYRSGDLGRWRADGRIEFMGRNDGQIKLRGFRIELGEIEAALQQLPGTREAVAVVREDGGARRLVAYLVGSEGDVNQWRQALAAKLPDYMLPSAFVALDALPLTANGKIDRKALPAPDESALAAQGYQAPRDAAEAALAAIWCELLRLERVGVHDNFFEIGGDSILSIQVAAKAAQAGLALTSRDLFQAQTIAALAARARSGAALAPQHDSAGAQRLLPVQREFFADAQDRHHFNQSLWLSTPVDFDPAALAPIVRALYRRHDALRLRFDADEQGIAAAYAPLDEALLDSAVAIEPGLHDLNERCERWQRGFDLSAGPLLRAIHFAPPPGEQGRLLLVAHHLVVDGVSWRILLADIERAYAQFRAGEPVVLAAKTASLQQWAERLAQWAQGEAGRAELAYWREQASEASDQADGERDHGHYGNARNLALALDEATTRDLLQRCNGAYRTRINELLLAAVYLGVRAWDGRERLSLRMEGHGRSAPQGESETDLSQTVGWFTCVYPLTLHAAEAHAGAAIKAIKERCRAVPGDGIGFGALRDLLGDPLLRAMREPEFEFNYLGQVDTMLEGQAGLRAAEGAAGAQVSPARRRPARWSLSALVAGDRLRLSLSHDPNRDGTADAERLLACIAESVRAVVAHCLQPESGGFTPSDFPLLALDQDAVDALRTRHPRLQRAYPATPMQAGLHYHAALDRSAYVVQIHPRLSGPLDPAAFRAAWQAVVDRHAILRTGFDSAGGPLLQAVADAAALPWHEEDWREIDDAQQQQGFEAYLSRDRAAGFELHAPPLMRVALFRLGDERWQLLWTQHHLLLDGWSLPLVYRDVMRAYAARRVGATEALPPPAAYEDYVAWLARQDDAAARGYWRERLAGIQAPTPLAIDHNDAAAAGEEHGHREIAAELDAAASQALRELAQRRRTTVNTLLQWSWAWLLHRYSGERQVVFGATVSGRDVDVPAVGEMVGLFINTLPVRVDFDGGTIGAALSRLHEQFQQSNAHGYLSLAQIQRESELTPGAALFDSVLAFDNYPLDAMADPALAADDGALRMEQRGHSERTHYALSLSAGLERTLSLRLGYRAERIAPAAAARLIAHLTSVLRRLPEAVDADTVELLEADERARLLALGAPSAPEASFVPAHERVLAWAQRRPDAVAIRTADGAVDYAELVRRARAVAAALRREGIGEGAIVAVCAGRNADAIAAMLGVLLAGAAYLPVDPAYPAERIGFMLADAGASRVLADAAGRKALQGAEAATPALELETLLVDTATDTALPATAPHTLAYLVYTSGSTGQPKGVMLEHRGLSNLAEAQQRLYATGPDSRVLGFASFGFDAAAWEWLMALTAGASLHLCGEDERLSAQALGERLAGEGITHATLPPVMLAQLDPQRGYALRALIVAGEACDERLAWTWAARAPMFNAYGPSENTVCATSAPIRAGEPIKLGAPLPGVSLRVCAADGALQPVGVPGELWLGGAGLARGYLGRPALSEERFVVADGERFYRSGDRARWDENGELRFLGRIDEQVKIRGYRVEPGEVEAAVAAEPEVAEAVVVARDDGAGLRLVAYVVAAAEAGDAQALTRALRERLARRLPAHMLPSAWVPLERLPVTANGKVDKRRLPAPAPTPAGADFVAARNEAERTLAAIWAQLLRAEAVGVHEDFFELGGDSILAIQAVARANQAGLAVTTAQLFEARTIAALAALAGTGARVLAPQEAVQGEQVLLPIQRDFLADAGAADDEDAHHFNQSVLLIAPAQFDEAALRALVSAVYARHDALRLRFARDAEGRWQSSYRPWDDAVLAQAAVVEPLGADLGERCDAWQRSFDLAAGPLLRAVWFRGEGGAGRLLLTAHHLVVDAVSWRILLADLERAWGQWRAGEPIALPPKTSSFAQWGAALQDWRDRDAGRRDAAWWDARLDDGVPALDGDHGRLGDSLAVNVWLENEETAALLQHCNAAYRTRVDELLLAAACLGLPHPRRDGALDVLIEGHGREALFAELDTTQTVGWFTSAHALPLRWRGDSLAAAIKDIKESVRAVPHRGLGHGVHERGAAGDGWLAFNYLGQFDQVVDAASAFQVAPEPSGAQGSARRRRPARHALTAMVFGGRLQLTLDVDGRRNDRAQAQAALDAIVAALRRIMAHCREPGVGGPTPADFPLARIDGAALDALAQRYPNLQRLYPATPMQRGLWFHAQLDPSAYVVQVHPRLRGPLDVDAFRAAWQDVLDRYDILRTAFVGAGEDLRQAVLERARLRWRSEDWSELDDAEQRARTDALLATDRAEGFDFASAPLMRVTLVRLGPEHHQLLWTQHHVLLDGWSMPLVYRDVMACYRARLAGHAPSLPVPAPYERYIAWLDGRDTDAARGFWRERLRGVSAPTPLCVDRQGAAAAGEGGYRERTLELGETATAALNALARERRTTVNTLVQWAWAYVLHRYSGESSVVFGATVAGRPAEVAGIESMVGLFINTLPVRVDFDPDESLERALAKLQERFARAGEHGYLPLAQIQSLSQVHGAPLFHSLLAFENYPLDAAEEAARDGAGDDAAASLRIEQAGSSEQTTYPLTLSATLDRHLSVRFGYRGEQFDDEAIQRTVGHLRRVLEQLPAALREGRRIDLLGADERAELDGWQRPAERFAVADTLHGLFEAQARRTPDAVALRSEGRELSYAELNRAANRVAHRLIALGVRPDDRVAIRAERGPAMLIGLIGILKSGAGYVPIDPAYPPARQAFMLADSAPAALLTDGEADPALAACPVLSIVGDEAGGEDDPRVPELGPQNLAYVIYTSGSTGQPKGVMVEHGNVVRLFAASARHFDFGADDVWTLFHSFAFDFSVWEIWGALLYGGRVVIVPSHIAQSPPQFLRLLSEEGVSVLNQTPSAFRALTAAQEPGHAHRLRAVIFGGEALELRALLPWIERNSLTRTRLVNMYGITETTVHVTFREIGEDEVRHGRSSPIGVPLADLSLRLLDADGEPVPLGVTGELYVAGAGVARGYLGRPELTAQRFLPLPEGGRLYRTGDLGRRLPDGSIEYLGRNDQQVKIRGFRIELGEIEAVLAQAPGVAEAVVVAREDRGDRRLVAYLVARPGAAPPALAELRELAARSLAAYMVPAAFVFLDALPLTGNGKLDRAALPAPDGGALATAAFEPPQGETETALAQIWRDALGAERIGRRDNFFEAGGHSLLAVKVLAQIKERFAVEATIRDVFERTTVAALAEYIDGRRQEAALRDAVAMDDPDGSDQGLIEL